MDGFGGPSDCRGSFATFVASEYNRGKWESPDTTKPKRDVNRVTPMRQEKCNEITELEDNSPTCHGSATLATPACAHNNNNCLNQVAPAPKIVGFGQLRRASEQRGSPSPINGFATPKSATLDNNKRNNLCYTCGKPGHYSRDCAELRQRFGSASTDPLSSSPSLSVSDSPNGNVTEGRSTSESPDSTRSRRDNGMNTVTPFQLGNCNNISEFEDSSPTCHGSATPAAPACANNNKSVNQTTPARNTVGFGPLRFANEQRGSPSSVNGFSTSKPASTLENIKRNNLCYNCGKPGHYARDCAELRQKSLDENATVGRGGRGYVPEEVSVEDLFEKTIISSGQRFDEFFDAEVSLSREGRTFSITACKSFYDGSLPIAIVDNIEKAKYKKLTPIQKYTIPLVLNGIDMMGCAPTGSGKTAAFLLPIMTLLMEEKIRMDSNQFALPAPRCLILSPTRELATQIHQDARKLGFGTRCESVVLYGGTSTAFQKNSLRPETKIVVATVGRLLEVIGSRAISLANVRYLVFDEADRMLDMGFGNDIERLMTNSDIVKEKLQTLMFSATFPSLVQELAAKHLRHNYAKVTIDGLGTANRCIKQEFVEVSKEGKKDKVLELLKIDMNSYSLKGQREEALHFFREGVVPVLIATSVAERGLDIRGVDHVINYDLPYNREMYVQRIGRTGRVGNPGRATSLYERSSDCELARGLVDVLLEVEQVPPNFLLRDAKSDGEIVTDFYEDITSTRSPLTSNDAAAVDDGDW